MPAPVNRKARRMILVLIVGVSYLAAHLAREGRIAIGGFVLWPRASSSSPGAVASADSGQIETLFTERRSDVVVQLSGVVDRVLADDSEGSRHQRFIVELASGHTVMVAHNIDLAPRVPVHRGDPVEVRGEYEWNERGGVVHWTHGDPQGRHEDGWIRHRGETYR